MTHNCCANEQKAQETFYCLLCDLVTWPLAVVTSLWNSSYRTRQCDFSPLAYIPALVSSITCHSCQQPKIEEASRGEVSSVEPGFLTFFCHECQNVAHHACTASLFQPHSEGTGAAPQAPEDECRMCLHFFLGIELVFL